jgi:hypothetical protein
LTKVEGRRRRGSTTRQEQQKPPKFPLGCSLASRALSTPLLLVGIIISPRPAQRKARPPPASQPSRAEPSRAHQPSHAIATSPLLSLPLACHIFFFLLLRRRRRLTFHLLSEAYLPGLYLPPGPPLLTGHCSGSSGQQQAHMVRTHGTARHHRIHSCQRIH